MKHEYSCIEIPCTCAQVLRERKKELEEELKSLKDKYDSCLKKVHDHLSCCCSGCQKHNAFVMGE